MLRKIFITSALLAPLLAFAQGNGHAYGHFKHAPEIDGSNIVLGIALLGGVLSLARRRKQK
jgi:LPXTG-motif cell wall-anchored protein